MASIATGASASGRPRHWWLVRVLASRTRCVTASASTSTSTSTSETRRAWRIAGTSGVCGDAPHSTCGTGHRRIVAVPTTHASPSPDHVVPVNQSTRR